MSDLILGIFAAFIGLLAILGTVKIAEIIEEIKRRRK
jgi:hypothetical protein